MSWLIGFCPVKHDLTKRYPPIFVKRIKDETIIHTTEEDNLIGSISIVEAILNFHLVIE